VKIKAIMELLTLDKLGAREIVSGIIQFGVFFPWVSATNGNRVFVKIIHEQDQFLQAIQPLSFELTHSIDPTYGDYWSTQVNIPSQTPPPKSFWGQPGTYIYRYEIHNPNVGILDWIVDPFAREFGVGKLSAFTLGFQDHPWSTNETTWKTPLLNDLIFYELQLEEFGENLEGAIERLPYLADLGVNCLAITQLGLRLGLDGFPTSAVRNSETLSKTALQYIENHDHERFICQFGLNREAEGLLKDGNRDRWYKIQPYLIGSLLAKGIPMLWQGQEFCENYFPATTVESGA
jgi:hypothetical protein